MWALEHPYAVVARLAWMDESLRASHLAYNVISLPASELIGKSLVAGMLPPLCTFNADVDCKMTRRPRQGLFGSSGTSMVALHVEYLCGPGDFSMVNTIVFMPEEVWLCIKVGYTCICVFVLLLIQRSSISLSI